MYSLILSIYLSTDLGKVSTRYQVRINDRTLIKGIVGLDLR